MGFKIIRTNSLNPKIITLEDSKPVSGKDRVSDALITNYVLLHYTLAIMKNIINVDDLYFHFLSKMSIDHMVYFLRSKKMMQLQKLEATKGFKYKHNVTSAVMSDMKSQWLEISQDKNF